MATVTQPAGAVVSDAEMLKWAIENLGVSGLSYGDDLSYLCRGNFVSIWRYLIDNVTNRDAAKRIHGNIKLHQHLSQISRLGRFKIAINSQNTFE